MKKEELIKSEYTVNMPEEAIKQTAQEIAELPEEQQREYAESLEPDNMGFSGKEGI